MASAVQLAPMGSPSDELSFASRHPEVLAGTLALDPAALHSARGVADALRAFVDFDAYSAAMRAFLVDRCAQLIAEEPLEGRGGQPTRLSGEVAHAAAVSEIASLQGTSEATAARSVNFSRALVGQHPAVHEALLSGDLTEAHAKVIVEQAATLPEGSAEQFGIEALGRFGTRRGHTRTPGELRRVVVALRERLHPESIARRRARSVADRGVWLRPEDDGMCTLAALLPAEIGVAAYECVDAIARVARATDGEHRTMPQLRADALAQGLLNTGATPEDRTPATDDAGPSPACPPSPAAVLPPDGLADLVRAEVVVHIPAAVLLGSSDDVAELEGYGVVDAGTARELAAAAPTWQRLFTDDHGVPLRLGRTAYRPPAGLRRFIRYRDGTCRVPGCASAARRSEVDHTVEWQDGGTTDAENLALLCRKHHALKSLALFSLRRRDRDERATNDQAPDGPLPDGGLVWTTLLGFDHPAEPLDRDHILGPRTVERASRAREPVRPPTRQPGPWDPDPPDADPPDPDHPAPDPQALDRPAEPPPF